MKAFVSTCLRPDNNLEKQAKHISEILNLPFIERGKASVKKLQNRTESPILVVGKERLELFALNQKDPLFFHPSSAMFRIKRLVNGETDPFIEVSGLEKGSSLLDCTLGLASDSLVAAFVVGQEGRVVGLEANKLLSFLFQKGLQTWDTDYIPLKNALAKVEVVQTSFESYLKNLPEDSFDCVYFDPMFEHSIEESKVMRNWQTAAIYSQLNHAIVKEAKRVAKKTVILKAHYRSSMFEELGFSRIPRKSAKFHFGYIQI